MDGIIDGRVRSLLDGSLSASEVVERHDSSGVVFELPVPQGAHYSFSVTTFELQIHAKPIESTGGEFWYWAYEEHDYVTPSEQEADFLSGIERILLHSTRITQHKKLLGHSFLCESEEGGVWKPVGGLYACSFLFKVPQISGRRHVYSSPAVVQANNSLQADRGR